MSANNWIVAEYSVPAPQAPGVEFKVTLNGDGEYACDCWQEDGANCQHIREVDAGLWHSPDPLARAVDLNRRMNGSWTERGQHHECV